MKTIASLIGAIALLGSMGAFALGDFNTSMVFGVWAIVVALWVLERGQREKK